MTIETHVSDECVETYKLGGFGWIQCLCGQVVLLSDAEH